MVFPVVMYGCESWTTKKAECQKIDAFKLLLEMTLESLLDSKEINSINPKRNQPWIFIGRSDAEAEAILWLSDVKSWLIRKDPGGGKNWGQEEKGWQRMRWLDGITDSMDMNLRKLRGQWWSEKPGVLQFIGSQRADMTATEQQLYRSLINQNPAVVLQSILFNS